LGQEEKAVRTRSTIIWIVILLLLGGLAYYFEFVVEKERKETEEKANMLFGFETYQIQELKLTRSGKTIRCIKGEGSAWNLTEPVQAVADESVVTDVLNGLAAAKIERVLSEKIDDPVAFGFDKPQYDVELKSKDKTYHLLLGNKNPTDYFYYAKYDGKLLLIPYSISYSLNKELFEFRDKTVISVNTKQTSALEIESDGGIVKLVRQEAGDWKVLEPKAVDAGADEVDKYITSVSLLRVAKFMEKDQSDPKTTGLDSPSLAIRLTVGENKTEKSLLIGKKEKDMYFARRGSAEEVFQLKASDVDNLKYNPDDFRAKQIFSFDKDKVQAIELKHSGITLVLKKVEDNWELEKPEPGPAKGLFVSELLSDILDLRVEKFLDSPANAEYGYDKPSIRVTLRFKEEKEAALLVGSKVEENVYVQVGSENYLVSAADVDQLKREPGHFQESDEKKKD
jgi:hypothetical protein